MLSRSEIVQEYAKCWIDYSYVIETYYKTFDQTQKGFVPFKLFPKQKEIIAAYKQHRFNLVTKPRQAGVSTTTAAYASTLVGFADKENPQAVLILANKQDMAFEFLGKIKEFLTQLPRWVWGPEYYGSEENEKKSIFIKDSQKEISLPNKSRIKAVATSKDALRGYTPTFLIMDEAAFIDNGDIVFGAALTALGTGGRATLISTPNGLDSLYYKTYSQSKSGKNNFNVIEMKWYEDLRYNKDLQWIKGDEVIEDTIKTFANNEKMLKDGYKPTSSWYEDMCKGMNNNAKMIAQELDVSFIGSGGNVIENEFIEFHEKENVQDPIMVSGPEQEFWIWEEPIEDHQYILAADVSRGDGNDYSTIQIIDFTTMTQVVEYQGKVPPNIFAQLIYEYGNKYKAYSVIDNIGVGAATILPLLEMNYKYLHYDNPRNKMLVDKRSFRAYDKGDKMAGFAVGNVRVTMVANFERAIRENEIKVRSTRLTTEMKTFIYQNGKPNHMSGYNDDLIMAMAMGLWVLEHSFKNLEKVGKQTKAMLSSWVMTNNSTTPTTGGFVPKELSGKAQLPKPNFSPSVARNMQDPKGDYLWLFSGMK